MLKIIIKFHNNDFIKMILRIIFLLYVFRNKILIVLIVLVNL
jgi:hypothetical protein